MNYEQLNQNDPMWIRFKDQIGFNTKILPNGAKFHAEEFIKVPFKDALNLVNNRQVFLFKGMAYVHISDLN
jgi:DNA primase large subunit